MPRHYFSDLEPQPDTSGSEFETPTQSDHDSDEGLDSPAQRAVMAEAREELSELHLDIAESILRINHGSSASRRRREISGSLPATKKMKIEHPDDADVKLEQEVGDARSPSQTRLADAGGVAIKLESETSGSLPAMKTETEDLGDNEVQVQQETKQGSSALKPGSKTAKASQSETVAPKSNPVLTGNKVKRVTKNQYYLTATPLDEVVPVKCGKCNQPIGVDEQPFEVSMSPLEGAYICKRNSRCRTPGCCPVVGVGRQRARVRVDEKPADGRLHVTDTDLKNAWRDHNNVRTYVVAACVRCRRVNVKCSGPPACEACRLAGLDCSLLTNSENSSHVLVACDRCRETKSRCSGDNPCLRCKEDGYGDHCKYSRTAEPRDETKLTYQTALQPTSGRDYI